MLSLRKHILEKEEKRQVQITSGVSPTWRNTSAQARLERGLVSQEARHRRQAERRREDPTLPFNPQNPFDVEDIPSQHMRSNSSAPSESSVSTTSTSLPSIRPEPIQRDSISRSSPISSAYAQQMPPPSQPSTKRSRQRSVSQQAEEAAHAQRMRSLHQRRDALLQEQRQREIQRAKEEIRILEESLGIRE